MGVAGPANPSWDHELEVLAGAGLCCFLGALLACDVTSAALLASRRAFGSDSHAAAAAWGVFVVCLGYLLYFALLALVWHLLNRSHNDEVRAREALIGGGGDATRPVVQRPLAGSIRARGRRDALNGPVTGRIYFASCVLMVGFLLLMLAPAKSYPERLGYLVAEIGWFLHSVAFFFVIGAALLVQCRSTYAKLKKD
ncbi:hypothetical protein HU200_036062 [Digitaria exilis]|uniref:Uncharacterized protein n=1 Tax=Digitaria exilis TaxID=1010633 RepID=A0A835EIL6_9POAL|nr:hypothetical protein HU200_036062 [Digitaria exilis]